MDGGQSPDGRYVVTAEPCATPKEGRTPASQEWRFLWRDTLTGASHTGRLLGLASGLDGVWYGVRAENLVAWKLGDEQPAQLLAQPALNDIAVSARGLLYFTTLKDPDKVRLTIVNTRDGSSRVAWDGEQESTLVNPNGVALSPDGGHLYVGISSYREKRHSGLYRFPVQPDGSLNVAAGKRQKFI